MTRDNEERWEASITMAELLYCLSLGSFVGWFGAGPYGCCFGYFTFTFNLIRSLVPFCPHSGKKAMKRTNGSLDEKFYRMFGYRNTELCRHYVRFNCAIAHSKALGNCIYIVQVSIFIPYLSYLFHQSERRACGLG